jgi:hypothetical protein
LQSELFEIYGEKNTKDRNHTQAQAKAAVSEDSNRAFSECVPALKNRHWLEKRFVFFLFRIFFLAPYTVAFQLSAFRQSAARKSRFS